MEKNIFSPSQERQILGALDEIDSDIGIDKLNDEKDLSRLLTKFADYGQEKSGASSRTTHFQLTRRSLGVYLGSAFTGGLAFAGVLVALIPTLMAPSIIATRSVSVDSDKALNGLSMAYQLPENLETQQTVDISTDNPYVLFMKLTEAATRAGLITFVLGGDANKLRINLYGLEKSNPQHRLVWELLGLTPSNYRSLSVVITKSS